MTMLEVRNLSRVFNYSNGLGQFHALKDLSFSLEKGEFVAVMGESGSGKSTLINALAMLDKPTSGEILMDGVDYNTLTDRKQTAYRRNNLGVVFQEFSLLDEFTLQDNIILPLVMNGTSIEEIERRLHSIADRLEIREQLLRYPYEVSGGQKQRAAIARALIIEPLLLLADEPTGALDSRATARLLNLFTGINREGQTILMVTHSARTSSYASRVLFIKDGQLFHQIYRGRFTAEEFYRKISETLQLILGKGYEL